MKCQTAWRGGNYQVAHHRFNSAFLIQDLDWDQDGKLIKSKKYFIYYLILQEYLINIRYIEQCFHSCGDKACTGMTGMVFTWQWDMARDVVTRRDKDLREHCHSRMLKTATASLLLRTSRGCRHWGVVPVVSQSLAKNRPTSDPYHRHGRNLRTDFNVSWLHTGRMPWTLGSPRNRWNISSY